LPAHLLAETVQAMTRPLFPTGIAALALAATMAADALATPQELLILGWAENVYLFEPAFELKAKLDSGAETSSLDARIIKKFRQGGKRWVRFALSDPETGEEYVLVRERVRTIGIIQHDGDTELRPTVMMQVCIADRALDVEVSLVDRSAFSYRLLLGRRALKSFALIDTGNTYLTQPRCKLPATVKESEL
jgi:hypothetical protein